MQRVSAASAFDTTALIVSYNSCAVVLEAVESVQGVCDAVVVDNGSSDGSPAALRAVFPGVPLLEPGVNLGFAAGVNRAAACARTPYLLLLNPDARLAPGALATLRQLLERQPRAAAVAPRLVYPDGRGQANAFHFPGFIQVALDLFPVARLSESRLNGRYAPATVAHPIDHPLGACMLLRRTAWEEVGPLDEGFFMYVEEVDWCRRARALGWDVWYEPQATAVHHSGFSTSQRRNRMLAQLWRARLRYYQRTTSAGTFRCLAGLIAIGLRAEQHRATHSMAGSALAARRRALDDIRSLAA